MLKAFYSIKEVQELLSCRYTTVYRMIKDGRLVSKPLCKGGRNRITASSLQPYLDNAPNPAPQPEVLPPTQPKRTSTLKELAKVRA